MAMYNSSFLNQYLPQQPTVPPALVPPQAKKNWQDKLGAFLIQGDANWNPDDATRKQMVKKGLLEAGLAMLANPTGAGNSPLAGISGGLLHGVQQMNAEAADLRGRTIGINGNVSPARIRELDQAAQMMGLVKGTQPYSDFMQRQYGGLPKASNMSEWTTKVTETGEIYRTNEMGGLQYFDKAQRKFVDMENSPTTDKQVVMDAPVNDSADAIANPEIKRRLEAGLPVNFKVENGQIVDLPVPSRIVTEGRTLPNLGGKPDAPKSAPALTDYDKKRAAIVSKYGEDAAIEWDATGKLPASLTTATGSGKNERQVSGENIARDAALERASALTGLPASALLKMNQQQFEAAVISKGKRTFQGPILGNVPIISDATNADVNSWTDQGGSGVALQMNPTGMITGADVNVGKGIFANSKDPINVQARKMWKAISPGTTPAPNASASVKKISNASEYNALPKGARFIDPDGNERIKP